MTAKQITVKDMAVVALVTAVICVIAPFSIPIAVSPVPMTLALFAIYLGGMILGCKRGLVSVLLYLLLGMVGLPIFSGFTGGAAKLIGPTGGYLIGYIFLVWITGFFVERFPNKKGMYFIGGAAGLMSCYLFGTVWFVLQYQVGFIAALTMCVIPYIPFDIMKLIAAVIIGSKVRKILLQQNLLS